jgi:dCTP deaminase
MYLSDVDIKKFIKDKIIEIEPTVQQKDFRPCGIRMHLSNIIYELNQAEEPVDIRDKKIMESRVLLSKFYKEINLQELEDNGKPYVLEPGKMILGSTIEKIKMPNYMVGFLDGRSTIARFGITNNITASLIDNMDNERPKDNITLEISNCGNLKFVLYPKLPIGILLFSILSSRTEILPSGQYADNQVIPNLTYAHIKDII